MSTFTQSSNSFSHTNSESSQQNLVSLEKPVFEVSIVMPCLNEAETIETCVKEAVAALTQNNILGEVIVADNGSTDGSQEIAQNAGARVVHVKSKGYGNALLAGFQEATGSYILMADSDGSYNFHDLPKFLERLREGDELVMGCRMPSGGGTIEPGAMPWLHRWIGNPILTGIGKVLFKATVDDFHCGIRAFKRETILNLNLRTTGMEFASEMVVRSTLEKVKISQVPVTLRPDGRSRPPHLRSWRDGWRHLRFLLLYSPKWLFLIPGLLLSLIGFVGLVLLTLSPLKIGHVIFDTNTMLICSMVFLLGIQVLVFYAYVKAYAISAGLLPNDDFLQKLLGKGTVEYGLLGGLFFVILGMGVLLYAFLSWSSGGFNSISYPDSLRVIVPAVTSIILGMQFIFAGFGLAIIGIKHK